MATKGACLEIVQMGAEFSMEYPCDAGRSNGPFAVDEEPNCDRCSHPFSKHAPYDAAAGPAMGASAVAPAHQPSIPSTFEFDFDATTCRREDTVEKLLEMLQKHIVIQVRGTPTSGKTVLSHLLHERVKK